MFYYVPRNLCISQSHKDFLYSINYITLFFTNVKDMIYDHMIYFMIIFYVGVGVEIHLFPNKLSVTCLIT